MDTQEILTPEEKLKLIGEKLIASMIKSDEQSKKNRVYCFSLFKPDVFKNENYLIYYTMFKFRDVGFSIDSDFLETYLLNNIRILNESKERIDLSAFADGEQDENISYIGATVKQFNRLSQGIVLDSDKFKLECEKYKILFISVESTKLYGIADRIVNDSVKIGYRTYSGFEDSKTYLSKEFARLEALTAGDNTEGFVVMRGRNEVEETKQVTKIADYGIKELDEAFGGIFTSQFISVLAPPKNGKTKFCAHIAHNVLMNGYGVAVLALEGGRVAFDAQLRAKHFDYSYNKDIIDIRDKKIGIDAGVIKEGSYPNEELRQLEYASKTDLYNNPEYGIVGFIETACDVDNLISNIDTMVNEINAKLVVIDYIQLISFAKTYKKNEAVGKAYVELLKYINRKNIALISPAQYTQEFLKDFAKGGGDDAEVRGAGGESAEIVRTPDVNIALWATAQDLARGQMSVLSIPSRNAKTFPKFDMLCDLGCCNYWTMPESMRG